MPPQLHSRFNLDDVIEFGIERTTEKAAKQRTIEEKQELLAFFRAVRIAKWPRQRLSELWISDETYFIVKRGKSGSFLDMIVEKLEASLASDREARKQLWNEKFERNSDRRE